MSRVLYIVANDSNYCAQLVENARYVSQFYGKRREESKHQRMLSGLTHILSQIEDRKHLIIKHRSSFLQTGFRNLEGMKTKNFNVVYGALWKCLYSYVKHDHVEFVEFPNNSYSPYYSACEDVLK